jgi:hypothetical protein
MTGEPPLRPFLRVVAWEDHAVERHGFSPMSEYVELCYLPVLGPTSTFLYRRLGTWAALEPEGFTVDLVDLSLSVGIGSGLGRNSPFARSLGRLASFHVAEWQDQELAVRRALPPVSNRRLEKLSPSAQAAHHRMMNQLREAS